MQKTLLGLAAAGLFCIGAARGDPVPSLWAPGLHPD